MIRTGEAMAAENIYYIGLDLGCTFLKYALGASDGSLIVKKKTPSRADQAQSVIFEVIFSAIEELMEEAKTRGGKVVAIGLGSPGAVDFKKCRLIGNTPNLQSWGNAEIRKTITGRFGLPIWADNDANVMALAEATQGAAKGYKYVIALTLGTGIGGGILIDGEIYRGINYAGAELGHLSIAYDGHPCNCGGRGCIEQYASAPAMVRNYLDKIKDASEEVTTITIFARAAEGDQSAIETIDETAEYLGAALASIINTFNPEIIVIGGGVADAGEEFLTRIRHAYEGRTMKPALKGLKLVRAKLGNDAGVVGAISLAKKMYEQSQ
jgi:glucokinase